jgi:DNA-binding PadR family transcriptional regulator
MAPDTDDLNAYLPLSPAVFHVMVSLGDADRHGYAIIKDVDERTAGAERLGAGTLYAILKRLLDDGLIAEVQGARAGNPAVNRTVNPTVNPTANNDERRRYYRLTPLGRRVAKAEVERLERASALARATRLFGKPRQV